MTPDEPTTGPDRASGSAGSGLRLVRNALVVLVFLPALAYAWWSVELARERAGFHARALAAVIAAAPDGDPLAPRRLELIIADERLGGVGDDRRQIRGHNGSVLGGNAGFAAVPWPSLTVQAPVIAHGGVVAHAVVRTPLRGILVTALLLSAFTAAIVGLVWKFGVNRSTSALREAEEKLRYISTRDPLTGLMNRDGLRPRLDRGIARSTRARRKAAVLLIDLDRFRVVNETLGNQAGDRLLRAVAGRLRAVTRRSDIVARLGVDQFAVLVEGLNDPKSVEAMAQNILRALDAPLVLNGRDLVTSASIGISIAPTHGVEADAILKNADAAMLVAKRAGGRRSRLFDPGMFDDTSMQFEIGTRLRRALEARELFLLFQPIVDARRGRVVGLEALLRWTSSDGLETGPAHFVPVLEQTGMIVQAGQWVLEEACRQGRQWIDAGHRHLYISVNMSPRQFAEADFLDMVSSVLSETRFPAGCLQLEVTEGLLLDPTADGLRKIEELARLGIRIAIDDFGMGYSSLAYLKRFRLHGLKVDRMFVQEMATQKEDALIVQAVINLGHGLGLSVTAEGVETPEQFRMLRQMGCDGLQGFLFGRPTQAQNVPTLLGREVVALNAGEVATPAPVTGASPALAPARPATETPASPAARPATKAPASTAARPAAMPQAQAAARPAAKPPASPAAIAPRPGPGQVTAPP